MQVYKIENNKLVSIKTVVDGYLLQENEQEGIAPSEIGNVLIDSIWQIDPQEIAEQQKQSRIVELKEIITNKKLLDMDCTAEQTELKGLLGL